MWIHNTPSPLAIRSDKSAGRTGANDSCWLFNYLTACPLLVFTEGADSPLKTVILTHEMVSFYARLYPKLRHPHFSC
jgi:hypothetical protein